MKKLAIIAVAAASLTGLTACTDTERAATLGAVAGAATVGAIAVSRRDRRRCYNGYYYYRC